MGRKKRTSVESEQPGGYYFDTKAADLAVDFFHSYLRHSKGEWAGQPFRLEPWQERDIIRPLFGWMRPDGTRKHRFVFVGIPRKNGKSTLAAGIACKLLLADHEPGAEVYSAAADRDQAAIVFEQAKSMIQSSEALLKRTEIYRRSVVVPSTLSSYKVISADAGTKHGFNAHGVIIDELHAHKNRELFEVLTSAQGSRRQPVVFVITTAGYDRKSVCWQEWEYARKVRDGVVIDPSYLPVLYEAPEGADWEDRKVWAMANPGLGTTVKPDYLEDQFCKAKESPAMQNAFRRLHLDQWTEQASKWLDMGVWRENGGEIDPEGLRGVDCWGGLDMSSTTDLSALCLAFPSGTDGVDLLWRIWIPEETASERSRKDRVPYLQWIREGWITATPGNVVDYDFVRRDIVALAENYNLQELAYDPWNATQIATQLEGDGLVMVQHRQGFVSMTEPSKEFEKLLLGRRLGHGDNPVATWAASNVAAKQDPAGNIKPDKSASGDRIDPIVAGIMAVGRLIVSTRGKSVYDTRGVITL